MLPESAHIRQHKPVLSRSKGTHFAAGDHAQICPVNIESSMIPLVYQFVSQCVFDVLLRKESVLAQHDTHVRRKASATVRSTGCAVDRHRRVGIV